MTKHRADFTYREGRLEDREQLKRLGILAYSPFSAVLTPENGAKLNAVLHDEQKLAELMNQSKCFVCVGTEAIIGMAYIVPNGHPQGVFKADWSYIRMVGVHPEYQGRGIAKTLIGMCIDFARQTNEQTIALHTSEFMDAARHIYEGLGFKVLREIEPIFGKKYWLYTLEL